VLFVSEHLDVRTGWKTAASLRVFCAFFSRERHKVRENKESFSLIFAF
jgi:hypothetical protein